MALLLGGYDGWDHGARGCDQWVGVVGGVDPRAVAFDGVGLYHRKVGLAVIRGSGA